MKALFKSMISVLLIMSLTACGTLIYPERRSQTSGELDIGVIALNGVGTILFFVPGVIAFAVDFVTGAIYLPNGQSSFLSATEQHKIQQQGHLTQQDLQQLLSRQSIQLETEYQWQAQEINQRTDLSFNTGILLIPQG